MIDPALRAEYVRELVLHGWSPVHPTACLCGQWDGTGTFLEHLADALLGLHPDTAG